MHLQVRHNFHRKEKNALNSVSFQKNAYQTFIILEMGINTLFGYM